MAAKVGSIKQLRVSNIAAEAKDEALIRFLSEICPGRRIKCSLSRDASQSPDSTFLQTATLELPDAECAETLLLHADGSVFLGRRLIVSDTASDAPSSSGIKINSASDVKKLRMACDLIHSASIDHLRDIMSLLERMSQSDADHVRQVLLSNPELSLSLATAAERLQLLDQPLKHAVVPAPAPKLSATSATAGVASVGGMMGLPAPYRQPQGSAAPPPPPPVNLPIEVQQALEMLLRDYPLLGPHFMQHRELHSLEKINIIRRLPDLQEKSLRTLGRSGELLIQLRGCMVASAQQTLAPPGGQHMW